MQMPVIIGLSLVAAVGVVGIFLFAQQGVAPKIEPSPQPTVLQTARPTPTATPFSLQQPVYYPIVTPTPEPTTVAQSGKGQCVPNTIIDRAYATREQMAAIQAYFKACGAQTTESACASVDVINTSTLKATSDGHTDCQWEAK